MTQKPDFPKISFREANKVKGELVSWFIIEKFYSNRIKIEGDTYQNIARAVKLKCSTKSAVVYQTTAEAVTSHLLGSETSSEVLQRFAEFVGHNIFAIRNNQVVMPGQKDGDAGWVPIQIMDINKNGSKLDLICKILWGPYYGRQVVKAVDPLGMAIRMLYRKAGIINKRQRYALPRDLVQMYLFADVTNGQAGLTFHKCEINPALKNKNLALIKARREACIRGFNRLCSQCPIGYSECFRGVRPMTITIEGKPNVGNVSEQTRAVLAK